MTLRVVGAGVGRTGTMSLKLALERLLGGPCYHMLEVFGRPGHVSDWHAAVRGELPEWDVLFDGFVAAVDFPACTFWRELAEAYPDAPVLLSTRDPDEWWRSCDRTIFEVFRGKVDWDDAWMGMAHDLLSRFDPGFLDEGSAKAAFVKHNETVREAIPAERLIDWQPGDGWGPICEGLGMPIPDEPFPHANTTDEFRSRAGWD